MKKIIFTLVIFPFCFHATNAQLRIAIAGGGHSSTIKETNELPNWSELESGYSGRTGVHIGFMADLQLGFNSKFYFQPGILFYNKGRKFSGTYDTAVYNYFSIDAKQFINYIEAPLNIVYKIPLTEKSKFFIGGGPYLSFFYNGLERTETYLKSGSVNTEENEDLPLGDGAGKYKTLDLGLNATTGIEFSKVFISANFSRGFTDMYTASYEGSFKNQVIGATIGVFIGKPVLLEEKVKDQDKDGVPDPDDYCETEPGTALTKGCPDTDADGIADRQDKCPTEKGLAENNGCPVIDTDKDGILDNADKCITVPGLAKYQGCPIPDTDGDTVNDEEDKCPTVSGFARYQGCPIPDSDGDGVNDEEDKCVKAPGSKENNGCPQVKQEVVQKIEYTAKRIQFEFAKSVLLDDSKKELDDLAELLKKEADLQLDIEGHTSNDGSFNANMKLSDERALTVMNYLIDKGIDANRLSAKGYGPSKPLNNGKTKKEKSQNRRVELKIRNN